MNDQQGRAEGTVIRKLDPQKLSHLKRALAPIWKMTSQDHVSHGIRRMRSDSRGQV